MTMREGPGCIQAIVIVVVLLFVAGLGGDTLKHMVGPWAQNALHLAVVAGLAWLIVRPKSTGRFRAGPTSACSPPCSSRSGSSAPPRRSG